MKMLKAALSPFAHEFRYARVRSAVAAKADGHEVAAVVHAYYPEAWPALREALQRGLPSGVPVFVTVPRGSAVAGMVRADLPDAHIAEVPNRGRDVLPFLEVSRALRSAGVQYVVKIHGKVSAHAADGRGWLESSLSALLSGRERASACLEALRGGAALVGPSEHYVPLTHYWEPNRSMVEAVSGPVEDPSRWGFFAGTMWWARLDAIAPFTGWGARRFSAEAGQYDGTWAHAFERLVCLQPQRSGKHLAAAGGNGVTLLT